MLLLLDYAETQADLAELVMELADLCDGQGLHLRYLASCRSSFVEPLPAEDYEHVPLDPPGPAGDWHEAHRRETVRHILAHARVPADPLHIDACRDVPVLAVFMAWLASQGREADLAGLLAEADFGAWVHKRIGLSFPEGARAVGRDLAVLAALYPLSEDGARALDPTPLAPLHRRFIDDGWVEREEDPWSVEARWVAVHDVLADGVFLAWVERHPHHATALVEEVLDVAAGLGGLGAALAAMQRVAGNTALMGLDWPLALQQLAIYFPGRVNL